MPTPLNFKKLLHSKWTAVKPIHKNKHFIVVKICPPELPTNPDLPPEFIEIEAIYSKKITQIAWRDLQDETMWKQGWL